MIDARNTYRTVTSTINDYSPGQLINFTAMMESYRGDEQAISHAADQHKAQVSNLAKTLAGAVGDLRRTCQIILEADSYALAELDFSTANDELSHAIEVDETMTLERSHELRDQLDAPVPVLSALLEQYQTQWVLERKALAALDKQEQNSDENKTKKKQLDAQGRQLKALTLAIKDYVDDYKEELANLKQAVKDWRMLEEYFPDGVYRDVEGLCKIVDLTEVAENDFSLTPGRYVGYRIEIDEGFDYQKRIAEINAELAGLNAEANELIRAIRDANL